MSKLMELAQKADSIAILGHIRPDGDCVGSCLATWNYLQEMFPDKMIQVYLEQPSEKFSYLNYFDRISQEISSVSYDLCICLDSGDRERLGDFVSYLDLAKMSLCVDHHITNQGYAQENVISPGVSSTSELVYTLMNPEFISKETAECIYTGILHDTNVFRNSNTTVKTMETAGAMMARGINFSEIIDKSFFNRTYVQNQILGRAILESVVFLEGTCIFSVVRRKDMEFYGVDGKDLNGIVDQLRITEGIEVAIFLYEIENHVYKVSMRSNRYVDVSRVAVFFGGGGHVRAAGCTMSGSVHDVINNLAIHIEKQIREHES